MKAKLAIIVLATSLFLASCASSYHYGSYRPGNGGCSKMRGHNEWTRK